MSRGNVSSGAHVVHVCVYHLVWATKYRRKVLDMTNSAGVTVSGRLKQIVADVAAEHGWAVQAIETMPDHVHLFVQADHDSSPAEIARAMKGRTSRLLREEFPVLRTRIPCLWTRSYFVATAGDVEAATIQHYVESQRTRQ